MVDNRYLDSEGNEEGCQGNTKKEKLLQTKSTAIEPIKPKTAELIPTPDHPNVISISPPNEDCLLPIPACSPPTANSVPRPAHPTPTIHPALLTPNDCPASTTVDNCQPTKPTPTASIVSCENPGEQEPEQTSSMHHPPPLPIQQTADTSLQSMTPLDDGAGLISGGSYITQNNELGDQRRVIDEELVRLIFGISNDVYPDLKTFIRQLGVTPNDCPVPATMYNVSAASCLSEERSTHHLFSYPNQQTADQTSSQFVASHNDGCGLDSGGNDITITIEVTNDQLRVILKNVVPPTIKNWNDVDVDLKKKILLELEMSCKGRLSPAMKESILHRCGVIYGEMTDALYEEESHTRVDKVFDWLYNYICLSMQLPKTLTEMEDEIKQYRSDATTYQMCSISSIMVATTWKLIVAEGPNQAKFKKLIYILVVPLVMLFAFSMLVKCTQMCRYERGLIKKTRVLWVCLQFSLILLYLALLIVVFILL